MNRFLLAFLIFGAGAFGVGSLRQTATETVFKTRADENACRAATNHLAGLNNDILALRNEVKDRKRQLQLLQVGKRDGVELQRSPGSGMDALDSHAVLASLREQWGMGWNDSKDYVLVDKQVLKKINFQPVDFGNRLTDEGRALLAISSEEQAGVNQAIRNVLSEHDDWARAHLERAEPSGDIVAKYTIPTDPEFELSISNEFSQNIVGLLGNERADILLQPAWNTIRLTTGSSENNGNTIVVRRDTTGTDSKLSYEWIYGSSSTPRDIKYGTAPPQPFKAVFPNGWLDIARREGFGLSKDFHYVPGGQ